MPKRCAAAVSGIIGVLGLMVAIGIAPSGQQPTEKGSGSSKQPLLDQCGDAMLQGAISPLGSKPIRQSGAEKSGLFSREGKLLLKAGGGLAFDPLGRFLASADFGGSLLLWDRTGKRRD